MLQTYLKTDLLQILSEVNMARKHPDQSNETFLVGKRMATMAVISLVRIKILLKAKLCKIEGLLILSQCCNWQENPLTIAISELL